MNKFSVDFYGHSCCDQCCNTVGYNFDCPICKEETRTSYPYSLEDGDYEDFTCKKCKTEFSFIDKKMNDKWEYNIMVKEGNNG